mgnify:FL=1
MRDRPDPHDPPAPASPGPARRLGSLWCKTSLRHARHQPWQTLALIAILGLGVGGFLSIQMANRAAVTGFEGFTDAVTGRSTVTVEKAVGPLSREELQRIRSIVGLRPAEVVPLIEKEAATTGEEPARPLRLLGVDLVGIQNAPVADSSGDLLPPPGEEPGLWSILRDRRSAWVAPELARREGLVPGDSWTIRARGAEHDLTVRGLLPPGEGGVSVPPNLVVLDLAAARSLLDRAGVDRVEILVDPDLSDAAALRGALADEVAAAGSGAWQVLLPGQQEAANAQMTAAFRLNLLILSLIALLVGLYLIALGMDAAVVKRRREIGILRSLGLTAAEIRKLWALDIAALALAGTAAGLVVGSLGSQLVVRAVARTVNTLYLETTAASASLQVGDVSMALLLGLGGGLLAAWLPLRDAASTPPAQVLRAGRFRPGLGLLRRPGLGLVLVLLGGAVLWLPPVPLPAGSRFPVAGYAAAFAWLIGGTLLVAGLVGPVARALASLRLPSPTLRHGFQRLRAASSRHRLAVAGLFVATGMALSMGIMVGSFESTVVRWLNVRFQADVYLSAPDAGGQPGVPFATIEWLEDQPEVRTVLPSARFPVSLEGRTVLLAGARYPDVLDEEEFLWIEEPLPRSAQPADADGFAVVNETFRYRFGKGQGDRVTLATPAGPRTLWIRAVKADYGNDRGLLETDLPSLRSWYDLPFHTNAVIHTEPGMPLPLEEWRARYPGLQFLRQDELRTTALRIFGETFTIAQAIQVLGLAVAFAGLALALLTIIREDAASLRTLRALGLDERRIAKVLATEGAGLAAVAVLGGLVLSLALAALLIFVINRQSFGWTLLYRLPVAEMALQAAGIITTGALVGWLCARAARARERSRSPES